MSQLTLIRKLIEEGLDKKEEIWEFVFGQFTKDDLRKLSDEDLVIKLLYALWSAYIDVQYNKDFDEEFSQCLEPGYFIHLHTYVKDIKTGEDLQVMLKSNYHPSHEECEEIAERIANNRKFKLMQSYTYRKLIEVVNSKGL